MLYFIPMFCSTSTNLFFEILGIEILRSIC
jgi:hypothetical protein